MTASASCAPLKCARPRATLHLVHKNAMSPPPCTGPLLVLDAPLAWLEPRLARRLDMMLDAGAMDEARALNTATTTARPAGPVSAAPKPWPFLRGRLNFEECRSLWLRNTRAYAKRQLTWFRARKQALWLPPEDVDGVVTAARSSWSAVKKGSMLKYFVGEGPPILLPRG